MQMIPFGDSHARMLLEMKKTLRMLLVVLLVNLAEVSASPSFQVNVSGTYSSVLIGEHQFLEIQLQNDSDVPKTVPDIKIGLDDGTVELVLLDEKDVPVPYLYHADLMPRTEAVTSLQPRKNLRHKFSTEYARLDFSRKGSYQILLTLSIEGNVYQRRWPLQVLSTENLRCGKSVELELDEKTVEEQESRVVLESYLIDDEWWLFYRNVYSAGGVLVKRIARLAGPKKFSVEPVGPDKFIDLSYTVVNETKVTNASLSYHYGEKTSHEK